jgi:hypothetical protein
MVLCFFSVFHQVLILGLIGLFARRGVITCTCEGIESVAEAGARASAVVVVVLVDMLALPLLLLVTILLNGGNGMARRVWVLVRSAGTLDVFDARHGGGGREVLRAAVAGKGVGVDRLRSAQVLLWTGIIERKCCNKLSGCH